LHIHPRDLDRLTVVEFRQAVAAMDGIREEHRKAAAKSGG